MCLTDFLALPTDGLIGSSHTGRRHIGSGRVPSAGLVIKHVSGISAPVPPRSRPADGIGAAWPAPSKQQHRKVSVSRPLSYHLKMIVDTKVTELNELLGNAILCSGTRGLRGKFSLTKYGVCAYSCHVRPLRQSGLRF